MLRWYGGLYIHLVMTWAMSLWSQIDWTMSMSSCSFGPKIATACSLIREQVVSIAWNGPLVWYSGVLTKPWKLKKLLLCISKLMKSTANMNACSSVSKASLSGAGSSPEEVLLEGWSLKTPPKSTHRFYPVWIVWFAVLCKCDLFLKGLWNLSHLYGVLTQNNCFFFGVLTA